MKTALFGGLLLLGTACASPEPAPEPMDPMAEMEAWMALNAIGPQQEAFQDQVGIWQTSMKIFMEPGSPPMEMQGESTMKTILGGRYLVEEFVSDFMGEPFEGMLIQGYDNLSQEYWTLWIDSTSTGYGLQHGQMQPDGSMALEGVAKDLRTPEGRPMRSVVTPVSDNEVIFKMYDTMPDGTEFQTMECTYTR